MSPTIPLYADPCNRSHINSMLLLPLQDYPPFFFHSFVSVSSKPTSDAMFSLTGVDVEGNNFPPRLTPPGSDDTLFLGGAGARGLEIQRTFVKFTAIGVYLEDHAVSSLAVRWAGKSAEELTESVEFFRDIVTGPFVKFTKITMIKPLTGPQYSEKVAENCVTIWKEAGIYTEKEANAIDIFLQAFKEETFQPGSSILFTQSPTGYLKIGFSKTESTSEEEKAKIDNKRLSEAILESIIGKHGVSGETKNSLAVRLAALMKHCHKEEKEI